MPGLCASHVLDRADVDLRYQRSKPASERILGVEKDTLRYIYRREFHSVGAISRPAKQFLARAINLLGEPSQRGNIPGKTRHGYKSTNRYDIFCYTVSTESNRAN